MKLHRAGFYSGPVAFFYQPMVVVVIPPGSGFVDLWRRESSSPWRIGAAAALNSDEMCVTGPEPFNRSNR